MKTVNTISGEKLTVVKVYNNNEKFFGKVLIKFDGFRTSTRFDVSYFNSVVEDKDKIK